MCNGIQACHFRDENTDAKILKHINQKKREVGLVTDRTMWATAFPTIYKLRAHTPEPDF